MRSSKAGKNAGKNVLLIYKIKNKLMETQKLFDKDKFYIIRADKAGMFMGKIDFVNGSQIGVRSLRRLYYWKGALDATQIAKCGVSRPNSCKFSEQLEETDLSVINNLIEFHAMTEEAVKSINSVPVWKN